ncbi:MAG: hypothetical protein IKB18_06750, partial [Tidjanibacter sp.]|nr:hypothetical protein [Tidjanibacter sp.]
CLFCVDVGFVLFRAFGCQQAAYALAYSHLPKFKIDKTKFCLKCSRSAESASSLCARLLAFAKIQNSKLRG